MIGPLLLCLALLLALTVVVCAGAQPHDGAVHAFTVDLRAKLPSLDIDAWLLHARKQRSLANLAVSDPRVLAQLMDVVTEHLGPGLKLTDRGAWIKRYAADLPNPFEAWHTDASRYCPDARQTRVAITLYMGEGSQARFCHRPPETCAALAAGDAFVIPSQSLEHQVLHQGGERLVLLVDVVRSHNRCLCGHVNACRDAVWGRILKCLAKQSRGAE